MDLREAIARAAADPDRVEQLVAACRQHPDDPVSAVVLPLLPGPAAPEPWWNRYYRPWAEVPAAERAWGALCDALPALADIEALPAALGHLLDRHWPDALRQLPPGWTTRPGGPRWAPVFRALRMGDAPDALLASPWLEHLTHLTLEGAELPMPAAPRRLPGLTHLVLEGDLDARTLRALTRWDLPGLRHLGLVSCGVDDAAAAELAAAWAEGRHAVPETLDLGQNPDLGANAIGDAGLAALARATGGALHTLLLRTDGALGDAGIVALAGAPGMAGLRALDLGPGARLSDTGVLALAHTRHLPALAHLRLHLDPDAQQDPEAAEALLRAHRPGLVALQVEEG